MPCVGGGDVPGSSSPGIFLSYRRADAAPYARLLKSELSERFPDTQVFMDLDSIEAGLPFADVIREAVESSAVLVALIGRQWVTLADEEEHRRLDDPDDLVRLEIQTALEREVRVIPVLVDGAKPLRQQQLPAGLQRLAGLNAFELSYGRYEYDAGRLLDLIQRVLATVRDRAEAERQAAAEAEHLAAAEAERKAREEAERKAREEAEREARAEAEWRVREGERLAWGQIGPETLIGELPALEEGALSAAAARQAAEARDRYAALLAVREKLSGPEHPDTLAVQDDLARWTGEAGDAAGARDRYAALLAVREKLSGSEYPTTLAVRDNLAYWTGRAGDAAGARDQYAALLVVRETVSSPEYPTTLTTRARLAWWTGEAGDAAGARDQYAALLAVREKVSGPEHRNTMAIRDNLAYWTRRAEGDKGPDAS
jgi:TIR domain-containing protein/tetratricopeptide repeat protein